MKTWTKIGIIGFALALSSCSKSNEDDVAYFRVVGDYSDGGDSGGEPLKIDACWLAQAPMTIGIFKLVTQPQHILADATVFCSPEWKYSDAITKYRFESVTPISGSPVPETFDAIGTPRFSASEGIIGAHYILQLFEYDGVYHITSEALEVDVTTQSAVHDDNTTIYLPSSVAELREECKAAIIAEPAECPYSGPKHWMNDDEARQYVYRNYYDRDSIEDDCAGAADPVDDPDPI